MAIIRNNIVIYIFIFVKGLLLNTVALYFMFASNITSKFRTLAISVTVDLRIYFTHNILE